MKIIVTIAVVLGTTPSASALAPGCGLTSETPATAEVETRARTACETARTRFAELFGEPVPAVEIVFWDKAGYYVGVAGDIAVVFWPADGAAPPHGGGPGPEELAAQAQWRDMLPHEISHALLAARFYPTGGSSSHGGYGTPLPDWLDEGVAIWAESPEHRAARLSHARELPAGDRDLRSILSAVHPSVAQGEFDASAAYLSGEASRTFYARSSALVTFVFETGGAKAMGELVGRLLAAVPVDAALLGLPGMPADYEELEARWEAWLEPQ